MRRPHGRHLALAIGLGAAAFALAAAARRRFSFTGRTVLVAGGSRGLGLVLARQLAASGARVAICARHSDELERAADDIARHGHGSVADFVCDLTDERQVDEMIDQIRALWGPVEALFNVAGMIQVGPFQTMTVQDVRSSLDIHIMAPLYTMRAVIPDMIARGEGRIVNISSIGGRVPVPHLAPYCAGKFGLTGLSRAIQIELASTGVRITTVCPGLMRTGSPPRALFKGKHRAEYAWFSIGDSLPLVTLSAEDAANRILAAAARGTPQVTLGVPAKAAALMDALAPTLTSAALAAVNRLLPGYGGIGQHALEGQFSTSDWSPSLLTALSDSASLRNNELVGYLEPQHPERLHS